MSIFKRHASFHPTLASNGRGRLRGADGHGPRGIGRVGGEGAREWNKKQTNSLNTIDCLQKLGSSFRCVFGRGEKCGEVALENQPGGPDERNSCALHGRVHRPLNHALPCKPLTTRLSTSLYSYSRSARLRVACPLLDSSSPRVVIVIVAGLLLLPNRTLLALSTQR